MGIAGRFWIWFCIGLAVTELVTALNETRYYASENQLIFTDQTLDNCIRVDYNLTALTERMFETASRLTKGRNQSEATQIRAHLDGYLRQMNAELDVRGCHQRYYYYDYEGESSYREPLIEFKSEISTYTGLEELSALVHMHNTLINEIRNRKTPYGYGSEFLHDGVLMTENQVEPIECTKSHFLFKTCATDVQMSEVRSIFVHHSTVKEINDDSEHNPWLPIPYYRGLYHVARINETLMFLRMERCRNIREKLFKCARPPADYDSLPFPLDRCHFRQLGEDDTFRLDCEVPLGGDAKAVIQTQHKWPVDADDEMPYRRKTKNLMVVVPEDLFGLKMGSIARVLDLPKVPKVVALNRTLLEEISEVDSRQRQPEKIGEPTSQTEDTFTLQLILEAILVLSMTFNLTFCAIIWCLRRRAPARKDPNNSFINCNYLD